MEFKTTKPLILASASPRRKELLSLIGVPFEVKTMEVDENSIYGGSASELVCNIAMEKGLAVAERNQHAIVISADTMVFIDDEPLGKPQSAEMAKRYLRRLSGRTHTVITGVAIYFEDICSVFFEKTKVTFYQLSDEWIDSYVASGDCFDKAGGYGIQTAGALMVEHINGDYNNVVGLPVAELYRELKNLQLIEWKSAGARHDH
ncbi:Maf family protein [Paenisporosarcina quisquiliarum]|uniref:dTTP/UTP pyrophosphatase n=1 Tax=Paenisporosarcina quisquiliarum TaxID=365346 RepID=A0A9X3LGW0_9BACL|nr:Maf family protein [Paenisporosarcina quisquiliarum]MCZ8536169.1 Maf family protein [Paenisporosarcina quisquiliarum]